MKDKKAYKFLRSVYKDVETDILVTIYDAVNDELIEREDNDRI